MMSPDHFVCAVDGRVRLKDWQLWKQKWKAAPMLAWKKGIRTHAFCSPAACKIAQIDLYADADWLASYLISNKARRDHRRC